MITEHETTTIHSNKQANMLEINDLIVKIRAHDAAIADGLEGHRLKAGHFVSLSFRGLIHLTPANQMYQPSE